jgi:hypothetical protein
MGPNLFIRFLLISVAVITIGNVFGRMAAQRDFARSFRGASVILICGIAVVGIALYRVSILNPTITVIAVGILIVSSLRAYARYRRV